MSVEVFSLSFRTGADGAISKKMLADQLHAIANMLEKHPKPSTREEELKFGQRFTIQGSGYNYGLLEYGTIQIEFQPAQITT